MLRGNEQKAIFGANEDKDKFVKILWQKKQDSKEKLYAFCIMDNHAHLVLREDLESGDPVHTLMKRIGVAYANYYNQKLKRVGHVFQDRFRSEPVEDEAYLLSLLRYVHHNPQKAGDKRGLSYPWSSYGLYMGGPVDRSLCEVEEILELFHINKAIAQECFARFHRAVEPKTFLDVPERSDKEPAVILQELLVKHRINPEDINKRECLSALRHVIRELVQATGISLRQAAEIVGINREKLRKLVMSKEPSP
ncbi:transposase [Sporomusa termitida]|uniref:Transposase IS200 like protein n=1 Tax=Sporomusa termitida TaxID=2377 RepID=A0A517DPX8_9FIRM|nr:transposase [Sporomusa termitida]QDR79414.1 Transposase IS200 like protein [Sporomusa termitida]